MSIQISDRDGDGWVNLPQENGMGYFVSPGKLERYAIEKKEFTS